MHANLKLGDIARSVVDAAQWAEAINRSGQLRMLSQRLARLAACHQERAEAHEPDVVATAQRLHDIAERRHDGLAGFALGELGVLGHFGDDSARQRKR